MVTPKYDCNLVNRHHDYHRLVEQSKLKADLNQLLDQIKDKYTLCQEWNKKYKVCSLPFPTQFSHSHIFCTMRFVYTNCAQIII